MEENNIEFNNNLENKNLKNIKDVDLSRYKVIKEETVYEDIEGGGKKEVKLIYMEKENKYYLNLKKAKDAYIERNRQKVNEQTNERYKQRYQNDTEFREKEKQKKREIYAKKKLLKQNNIENN